MVGVEIWQKSGSLRKFEAAFVNGGPPNGADHVPKPAPK